MGDDAIFQWSLLLALGRLRVAQQLRFESCSRHCPPQPPQLSWLPLLSRSTFHGIFPGRFMNRSDSPLQKTWAVILPLVLFPSLRSHFQLFNSILNIHLRLFKKPSTINIKSLESPSTKKGWLGDEGKAKGNRNKSHSRNFWHSLPLNLLQKAVPISLGTITF